MNLERHIEAHKQLFLNLVRGDGRLGGQAQGVLRRISGGDGSRRRILSADRRDRIRAPRVAEGRDDPSRPAGRSGPRSTPRCSPSKASTTTFPASARPRRRIACARTSRPTGRRIGCSPASAITGCSTARASARRSPRASPTSCCRSARAGAPRAATASRSAGCPSNGALAQA